MANYLFSFYTPYFKTLYLLIAYVYVVSVIFIIKSDLMKQKAEIGRIIEQQKENMDEEEHQHVEENKEENKKPEKDKENDESKEKNDGEDVLGEPDASEI